MKKQQTSVEMLKLKDQVNHIQQEGRMVLPGIQALFGFQLMAVFSAGFKTEYSPMQQEMHYIALTLSALATLVVLIPAAYHRQAKRDCVTSHYVTISNRCILAAMGFLGGAICLDYILIGEVVGLSHGVNTVSGIALTISFFLAWFIYPRQCAKRNWH